MTKISMCMASVVALLIGCSSPEEEFVSNVKEQEAILVKINEIVQVNPNDERVEKMLRDVSKLEMESVYIKMQYGGCSQRTFDYFYRNSLSNNIDYKIKLHGSDSPENLLEIYKKYGTSYYQMDKVDCLEHVRPEYLMAKKDLDGINIKLKEKFKKESGQDFDEQWKIKVSKDYVSNRVKTWDELNGREKSLWAQDDTDVARCIDTALSANQQAENIPNIISDTASLCRKGLGR